MIEHPTEKAVRELGHEWPNWEIWIVWRVYGGPLICARPRDNHAHVIHANDPGEMAEKIEAEVTGNA